MELKMIMKIIKQEWKNYNIIIKWYQITNKAWNRCADHCWEGGHSSRAPVYGCGILHIQEEHGFPSATSPETEWFRYRQTSLLSPERWSSSWKDQQGGSPRLSRERWWPFLKLSLGQWYCSIRSAPCCKGAPRGMCKLMNQTQIRSKSAPEPKLNYIIQKQTFFVPRPGSPPLKICSSRMHYHLSVRCSARPYRHLLMIMDYCAGQNIHRYGRHLVILQPLRSYFLDSLLQNREEKEFKGLI